MTQAKMLISGFQTTSQKVSLPENVEILHSIAEVKTFITSVSLLNKAL